MSIHTAGFKGLSVNIYVGKKKLYNVGEETENREEEIGAFYRQNNGINMDIKVSFNWVQAFLYSYGVFCQCIFLWFGYANLERLYFTYWLDL